MALSWAAVAPLLAAGGTSATAEERADRTAILTAFRAEFFDKERSYSAAARTRAAALLDSLSLGATRLTDPQFELRLAEIVAVADNGHTLFFMGFWQKRYNRIPIKYLILEHRLYVGTADSAHANLIGAEVTRIGRTPWADVMRALARYQGGIDGWREEFLPFFIESPEILHAAGLIDSADSIVLSGVTAGGRAFRTRVGISDFFPRLKGGELYLPPSRVIELVRDGHGPRSDNRPLYLRDIARPFRFEWLEGNVAYIQFKANAGDYEGVTVRDFSESVSARLRERAPSHIVVDQRFNSGGDLNLTRDLMQALPGLVAAGGKIYVITSRHTFSAGIASTGYLKQAGGDRVVIVGEPIGDRLEFWAEGGVAPLPAGMGMLYARERHNYMTGCPEPDCHGAIRNHPIHVNSLAPDYPAPLTYAEYAAGRDPAMEKILSLIRAKE